MEAVDVDIFVLNFNGRALLASCLPSVMRAAAESRHDCRVTVVDNGSGDDSVAFVAEEFPSVGIVRMPNLGLASFNEAVAACRARIVVLLNNDIRLDEAAIDPLVDPLVECDVASPVFMTVPRCTLFDGVTHEGFKTAVEWRYGIVRATAHFPGAEDAAALPGPTASAGAVLAVDREKFLQLGGFDPLYLPGRIEDLDFSFRGYVAGYTARYVPNALAQHAGAASFGPKFGVEGCLHLALRNTLLFQWKNLRHWRHRLRHAAALPLRAAFDVVTGIGRPSSERFRFLRAWRAARNIWHSRPRSAEFAVICDAASLDRERRYFAEHSSSKLRRAPSSPNEKRVADWKAEESQRASRYPMARWYIRPAAEQIARWLSRGPVQPWHLTLLGLCLAAAAASRLLIGGAGLAAAGLLLAAYLCDRIDGPLARLRGSASAWGAWLDANVDEAIDLGLHVCMATVAAGVVGRPWPWSLLIAFLVGKYLLMHGLYGPAENRAEGDPAKGGTSSVLRSLYHFPANSDVRMHLLIVALATGMLAEELAIVACYYNLRWPLRYLLVARRTCAAAISRGAV